MWNLIKSEFRYNRVKMLSQLLIIPAYSLYIMWSSSKSWFGIPSILTVALAVQIVIDRNLEKRERQNILLPLACKNIAYVRILLILLPGIVVFSAYIVIRLIIAHNLPSWEYGGIDLLMFAGLFLLGFSIYFIQRDLSYMKTKKVRRAENDVIILLVLLVIMILGIPLTIAVSYNEVVDAESLISVLSILGLLLLYPTVVTFYRRKSYLE